MLWISCLNLNSHLPFTESVMAVHHTYFSLVCKLRSNIKDWLDPNPLFIFIS